MISEEDDGCAILSAKASTAVVLWQKLFWIMQKQKKNAKTDLMENIEVGVWPKLIKLEIAYKNNYLNFLSTSIASFNKTSNWSKSISSADL